VYSLPNKESSPQEISIMSQFVIPERDGVIVILWWTEYSPLYQFYYHIDVKPQPAVINLTLERTSIELKVSYNILYNVTVVAVPFCGQNNVTTSTELIYSK
jgi:hypothetical protein